MLQRLFARLKRACEKVQVPASESKTRSQPSRQGAQGRSRAACLESLSGTPVDDEALGRLEDLAYQDQRYDEAIVALQVARRLVPGKATLAYRLGCLLQAADQIAPAAEQFRESLALDPAQPRAHNNLGCCLQQLGDHEGARSCYTRALELEPGLWQGHDNLGILLKQEGRMPEAIAAFQRSTRLRRALGPPGADCTALFEVVSESKLDHDIEQLQYLSDLNLLDHCHLGSINALVKARSALAPAFAKHGLAPFPRSMQGEAVDVYNRLLHVYDAPRLPGPAINPKLDRQAIEAAYHGTGPGITHVDDVLTPEALEGLRRYCLESTIWFDFMYQSGYLGAKFDDGFGCPLLVQIAEELRQALPGIIADHPWTYMWGYKYDSQRSGIGEHADFAAINVNFWITPDEANLEPGRGGLVIWDKEAPLDWDFREYNSDQERIRAFLASSGAQQVVIPHRQNRAAIFNSDLFHRTDDYHFKPGYENRRINITILYGYRHGHSDPRQR